MGILSRLFGTAGNAVPPGIPAGTLFFKEPAEAFAYACKYLDCTLKQGAYLPAIVMDARRQPDGNQVVMLRVAASDGGFYIPAFTAGPKGPELQIGDLVLWAAMQHTPAAAALGKDLRRGWMGLVVGTLKHEYRNGSWVGGAKFSA